MRLSTPDEADIVALRLKQDEEGPRVSDLVVIFGVEVEFEPVRVVDAYRIRDF